MIDALTRIEPFMLNLESTIGIMTHLVDGEYQCVHRNEWNKLLNDMRQGVFEIQELLDTVCEEQKAEAEKHAAALAAARAEKAAPGSKESLERADALWMLLRAAVAAASEWCIEAGYPPRLAPAVGFAEEAQS